VIMKSVKNENNDSVNQKRKLSGSRMTDVLEQFAESILALRIKEQTWKGVSIGVIDPRKKPYQDCVSYVDEILAECSFEEYNELLSITLLNCPLLAAHSCNYNVVYYRKLVQKVITDPPSRLPASFGEHVHKLLTHIESLDVSVRAISIARNTIRKDRLLAAVDVASHPKVFWALLEDGAFSEHDLIDLSHRWPTPLCTLKLRLSCVLSTLSKDTIVLSEDKTRLMRLFMEEDDGYNFIHKLVSREDMNTLIAHIRAKHLNIRFVPSILQALRGRLTKGYWFASDRQATNVETFVEAFRDASPDRAGLSDRFIQKFIHSNTEMNIFIRGQF